MIICLALLWFLMAESVTIDCKYSKRAVIRRLTKGMPKKQQKLLPDDYYCEAKISKKCNASNVVIGISNNHMKTKSICDIRYLIARYQKISDFPLEMEKLLPNLVSFIVMKVGLKRISKDVLKYPKLKHINLSYNKLKSLDSDLFEFVPNLRSFYVANNPITHVGLNILDSLRQLRTVDFQGSCISFPMIHNFHADSKQKVEELKRELKRTCPPPLQKMNDDANELIVGNIKLSQNKIEITDSKGKLEMTQNKIKESVKDSEEISKLTPNQVTKPTKDNRRKVTTTQNPTTKSVEEPEAILKLTTNQILPTTEATGEKSTTKQNPIIGSIQVITGKCTDKYDYEKKTKSCKKAEK